MTGVESRPPEFALHWASQLGASPLSLKRLRGGINNRVYRCNQRQQQWVIKGYAPAQPGQRDRMQAEVEFLQFAAYAAPGFTPALIETDTKRRCVVLEHLEGEAFPEGKSPSNAVVADAVKFFRLLNAQRPLARQSIQMDAAEGFLSLREHLRNVRERLERMSIVHLDHALRPEAKILLQNLRCELDHTEERTYSLIDKGLIADAIDPNERCLSPSDFGFHNAVHMGSITRFIDFEFSGWDDPAKALLDFILQPRIPVSGEHSPLLLALHPDQRESTANRCTSLKPILRIKWACIILSALDPERLKQISLANSESDINFLASERLRSARRYLSAKKYAANSFFETS